MYDKNVNLHIRTSKTLKEAVGSILHELGLNHSIVVNMLYRQILIQKEIPFPIKLPNTATQKAINELENKEDLKTYRDSDELFNELGI